MCDPSVFPSRYRLARQLLATTVTVVVQLSLLPLASATMKRTLNTPVVVKVSGSTCIEVIAQLSVDPALIWTGHTVATP